MATNSAGTIVAGRYRLDELLGHGGMATVYRASDLTLGRAVALKLLKTDGTDPDAVRRQQSEVRLLAGLSHPALVTLFDAVAGEGPDDSFIVMELVEGTSLRARLDRGPIASRDAAELAADLADALHVVHQAGIVHRDIKPANVLLAPSHDPELEFRAKLADFGIAYLAGSTRVTAAGTLIGTAAYLSPEQVHGEVPAAASDVYSLGLVLLECLTGIQPYPGSVAEAVSARLARDPDVPAHLGYSWRSLLSAMTARDPSARPSALEVAAAARALARGDALDEQDPEITAIGAPPMSDGAPTPETGSAADATSTTLQLPAQAGASGHPPTTPLGSGDVSRPLGYEPVAEGGEPALTGVETAPASPPRRRRAPRVLAGAGVLAVLVAAAIAVALALNAPQAPRTAPTPVPSVSGPLSTHLGQLRESVQP
jgi:serine/threonine protein kinase